MNIDGERLIEALCRKLKDENKLCYDSQIILLLRSLTRHDLNQLITFGDIDVWVRERNARNN